MKTMEPKKSSQIALTIIAVAILVVVVLLITRDPKLNNGLAVTLIGIVSVISLQLTTNSKLNNNTEKTDDMQHQMTNGFIPDKVAEALKSDEAQIAIQNAVNNTLRDKGL